MDGSWRVARWFRLDRLGRTVPMLLAQKLMHGCSTRRSRAITLIRMDVFFPMAGQGARFGHRFKPFLTIGDQLFIEAAVEPFRRFQSQIGRFVFVYLEAQEQEFNVSRRLQEVLSGLSIATVRLAAPTRGPAETIVRAIEQLREPVGAAFVCDCDHSLDVEPLFRWVSENPDFDALLPVWPLERENLDAWSVAMVEGDRVWGMSEKRLPDATRGTAMGVIGCYGFHDLARVSARGSALVATNFSDIVADMLATGDVVNAVPIGSARFFGDPARLARAVEGVS